MRTLEDLTLYSGAHLANSGEMCVMEAVAYFANEPWSDHPKCACPTITEFMISWNDSLPSNAERDRLLKPLIPLLVGTNKGPEAALVRSYMVADWLIRTYAPAFLDLNESTKEHGANLRLLGEVKDKESFNLANAPTAAARDAAGAAAGAAARDAAGAAAGAAARAAARDAARDAAGAAARDAARDAAGAAARAAAGDAARDAAREAAWAAARAALRPTVTRLQESALELIHRMIELAEVF